MINITKLTTRAQLSTLIPYGGLVVELGVARGRFACQLIETNPGIRYVGIDRWSDHHDGEEYAQAKTLIDIMGGQVIRSTFADALDGFLDGKAEMIYVDGYAHTGQEGGQTLRDWWPKLKQGGIFAGHDYDPIHYPQTVAAVDAFLAEHGLTINVIDELPHPSWWVVKR